MKAFLKTEFNFKTNRMILVDSSIALIRNKKEDSSLLIHDCEEGKSCGTVYRLS